MADAPNALYYGDNLPVLREHVRDESVDLVYLDPPFNSNAAYNVLFKSPEGASSEAQIEAFDDTWHWGREAEDAFDETMKSGNTDASEMLRAMRAFLGESDMMAYLAMMAIRLLELRRVLKPEGSLYLHCDPTASHYLKLLLDAAFGKSGFVNEIVWKRSSAHSDAKQGAKHFGRVTDTIFFYSKGKNRTWNVQYRPYDPEYLESDYWRVDEDGRRYRISDISGPGGKEKGNPYYEVMGVKRHWRYSKKKMAELIRQGRIVQTRPGAVPQLKRYLDEMPGVPVQNLWDDVPVISNRSKERLGYPTQKPVALLERILSASSNPGDVVLDPFCGCGTTIHAAEKLGRRWIGVDVTHLAISLIEARLRETFPAARFEVHGTPKDLAGARALAARDKHQFQWWALSLLPGAVPYGGRKKGADSGIDGILYFRPDWRRVEKAIVSVKGGESVGVGMVRDLAAVVEREGAGLGILVSLAEPTGPMRKEAAAAGFYEQTMGKRVLAKFPRLQLLTVEELFAGRRPEVPNVDPSVAKRTAPREARRDEQPSLDYENGHKGKPKA